MSQGGLYFLWHWVEALCLLCMWGYWNTDLRLTPGQVTGNPFLFNQPVLRGFLFFFKSTPLPFLEYYRLLQLVCKHLFLHPVLHASPSISSPSVGFSCLGCLSKLQVSKFGCCVSDEGLSFLIRHYAPCSLSLLKLLNVLNKRTNRCCLDLHLPHPPQMLRHWLNLVGAKHPVLFNVCTRQIACKKCRQVKGLV